MEQPARHPTSKTTTPHLFTGSPSSSAKALHDQHGPSSRCTSQTNHALSSSTPPHLDGCPVINRTNGHYTHPSSLAVPCVPPKRPTCSRNTREKQGRLKSEILNHGRLNSAFHQLKSLSANPKPYRNPVTLPLPVFKISPGLHHHQSRPPGSLAINQHRLS